MNGSLKRASYAFRRPRLTPYPNLTWKNGLIYHSGPRSLGRNWFGCYSGPIRHRCHSAHAGFCQSRMNHLFDAGLTRTNWTYGASLSGLWCAYFRSNSATKTRYGRTWNFCCGLFSSDWSAWSSYRDHRRS